MKIKALSFLPGAIALILAAAPIIPTFTQAAYAGPGKEGRMERKFDQLNLTDDQKARIKQIQESAREQMSNVFTAEQKQQMQTARQQRQRPQLNLTEDQKAKIKAIRQESKRQMDEVLTAEQKQKLQEMRQQWQQNRPNRQNRSQQQQ